LIALGLGDPDSKPDFSCPLFEIMTVGKHNWIEEIFQIKTATDSYMYPGALI
jgi:hypothetical protein